MGSVINPVKSYTTSAQFSPAGFYCFGLDGFCGFFYNNNDIFNNVILSDFKDVLSIGVLFHSVDDPFTISGGMSLKGPVTP